MSSIDRTPGTVTPQASSLQGGYRFCGPKVFVASVELLDWHLRRSQTEEDPRFVTADLASIDDPTGSQKAVLRRLGAPALSRL